MTFGIRFALKYQANGYQIIRNQSGYDAIRTYIRNNPFQWYLDNENPANFQTP